MSQSLTVIYWRDIPAQVVAGRGRQSHKVQLAGRFQAAIDRAAMEAGLAGTDDYLAEWRRSARPIDADPAGAAAAEAQRLEEAFPASVLRQFVANHGFDPGRDTGAGP